MELWEPQGQRLKERVLEYIKNKVDEKGRIYIGGDKRESLFKEDGRYIYMYSISYIERAVIDVDFLSIDKALILADKIHLLPLKNFKHESGDQAKMD